MCTNSHERAMFIRSLWSLLRTKTHNSFIFGKEERKTELDLSRSLGEVKYHTTSLFWVVTHQVEFRIKIGQNFPSPEGCRDTQQNDIQHNDTQHINKNVTALQRSSSTWCLVLSVVKCWESFMLSIVLFIVMLSVVAPSARPLEWMNQGQHSF